ncbi:hypothetical protein BDA99DRAFT_449249, partial [Phascolomyces articulosus]
WAYAYIDPLQCAFLTNNYIKLWHNQLKAVYLQHTHNKCFDHLIFILMNEVEFYFQ